jgi:uncharacterized membrane protein YdjX (TVP38/TMEM64 family)
MEQVVPLFGRDVMRLLLWMSLLILISLGGWFWMGESLEREWSVAGAVDLFEQNPSVAWLIGWGLLVGDVFLPIPSTVIMSSFGWVYGTLLGGLLASAGSMLAGLTAYGVGRLFGEKGARRILGSKDLERGRGIFQRGGGWWICLSRALPIFPEAIACTAGLVRMPFRRFLPPLLCGCIPMGWTFAAIGAAGHDRPGLAIGLSLALPAILWGVARRRIGRGTGKSDEAIDSER